MLIIKTQCCPTSKKESDDSKNGIRPPSPPPANTQCDHEMYYAMQSSHNYFYGASMAFCFLFFSLFVPSSRSVRICYFLMEAAGPCLMVSMKLFFPCWVIIVYYSTKQKKVKSPMTLFTSCQSGMSLTHTHQACHRYTLDNRKRKTLQWKKILDVNKYEYRW